MNCSPAPASSGGNGLLTEVRRRAMATDFVVLLPRSAATAASRASVDLAVEALDAVEAWEQRLSVYDPASEISALNRQAADAPVHVSQPTWEVLTLAASLAAETAGAFDVTAGPLVDAWGFLRRAGRKPTEAEIAAALQRVGWQKLQFDPGSRTVRFTVPGMQINLGAIGKGYALDQVADALREAGVEHFLIHGGQSSVLAQGDADPEESPGRGWRIGVTHPKHPRRRLGGIGLRDQALATSGPGKQFFHHRGKRYGHVIDPRTGWPAGDLEALTVVTASAARADALATGWFVAGREAALAASEGEDATGVLAVQATERQAGVRVEVAGLPPEAWAAEAATRPAESTQPAENTARPDARRAP